MDAAWAALDECLAAAEAVAAEAEANPLRWFRWLPPQDDWLRLRAARKLFRAGNQALGKTTAGLAEVIWRCTGTHPHIPTPQPPIEAWVVCTQWSQSVQVMGKFWALCPPDLIDAEKSSHFTARSGYGKDNPAVIFRCGSILRFKTTGQGAAALASGTIDLVLIDEPTEEDVYRELDRRVMRRAGAILLTLTPVNGPCEWLQELVGKGAIEEVHARLLAEHLVPVGAAAPIRLGDGTPMDEAWVAAERLKVPAMWAPVVLDGEWETRPEGVIFDAFDPRRHVSAAANHDPRLGDIRLALGIDYAGIDREAGQCATLWQVQHGTDDRGHPREHLIALDEVAMSGIATNKQFAIELLAMLARNGLQWRNLDHVHGDNPVSMGGGHIKRSNIQTMEALARELRLPSAQALRPRILNAKDGPPSAGAVATGVRYLHERIGSGELLVRPACPHLIWALQTWDGSKTHEAKDILDSARYALKPMVFPRPSLRAVQVRFG